MTRPTMTDEEQWRPIPGYERCYEVSNRGRIRGVHRIIIRSNGYPYTAQARVLRPYRYPISGLLTVTLASRGERHDVVRSPSRRRRIRQDESERSMKKQKPKPCLIRP